MVESQDEYPSFMEYEISYIESFKSIPEELFRVIKFDMWKNYMKEVNIHKNLKRIPIDDLEKIKEGDSIKICNGKERFWVNIKKFNYNNNIIVGVISNGLVFDEEYNLGDLVICGYHHIYDIHFITDKKVKEELIQKCIESNILTPDDNIRLVNKNENEKI